MAKPLQAMTGAHIRFLEDQHIYHVGTAAANGRLNVSPKGMDSLKVINAKGVVRTAYQQKSSDKISGFSRTRR